MGPQKARAKMLHRPIECRAASPSMCPGPTISSVAHASASIATFVQRLDTPVRGVVVFFHGLALHSQLPRYRELFAALHSKGFEVWTWDCPHHGRSSSLGDPSHPLKPLRLPTTRNLLVDAMQLVRLAQRPGTPLLFVGESMGAALALRLANILNPTGVCCIAGGVAPRVSWLGGTLKTVRVLMASPRESVTEARRDPLLKFGLPPASVAQTLDSLARRTELPKISFLTSMVQLWQPSYVTN